MENYSTVSVIVPVYNGKRTIVKTLEHLLQQSLAPREIIIVDDGSTDGTLELLKQFDGRIIALPKHNGGPASARNYGLRAASGEFIAFTDSDCFPDKDWLFNLLKAFDDAKVAGVGGVVKGAYKGLISDYVDSVHILDPGIINGEVHHLVTANACFRRDVLLQSGLFDERFKKPGGEEPELCKRILDLGYTLRATDDAVVLHHHKQNMRSLLKTLANYGEGRYIFERIRPEIERDAKYHLKWKINHKELIRSLIAVRHMFRKSLQNKAAHGFKRALVFSFLDNIGHSAFLWGYLRGRKNETKINPSVASPYARKS